MHERAVTVEYLGGKDRRAGSIPQPGEQIGRQLSQALIDPRNLPGSVDAVVVEVGVV